MTAPLDSPWMLLLGWAVLCALWHTTLAATAVELWCLARPRATAAARHVVACAALAAALLVSLATPMAVVVLSRTDMDVTAAMSPGGVTDVSPANGTPPARHDGPALLAQSHGTARWAQSARPLSMPPAWLGMIALVWTAGAALLLARLLAGWFGVRRLVARAALVDAGPLRDTFDEAREAAGVQDVRLTMSLDVEAPVVVGQREPTLLMPAPVLEHLPAESLRPILAHELAHVARRDYIVNIAQSVAEALLWTCPATYWLGRRIREAREFCCDDRAAAIAGHRAAYVEALTLVARLGVVSGARPVLGMAGPRLVTRVRRLISGETPMTHRALRAAPLVLAALLAASSLPMPVRAASRHLSTEFLAAGTAQGAAAVPISYPRRQDGSGLQIRRAESTATHVCGAFDVENMTDEPVSRVRFVGVLSFARSADRPVEIVESEWIDTSIAPGAVARLEPALIDVAAARASAAGGHVQARCALREVVHENQASWSVRINAAVATAEDAFGTAMPTLPRALVGQTAAYATARTTLCLDEHGLEYSPGGQIGIRDEPGRAARCTTDGQWVEVDPRTGAPLHADVSPAMSDAVAVELRVAGVPALVSMKSAVGALATLRLPGGQTWGVVPLRRSGDDVQIELHDLSARPHRLLGTRTVGATDEVTFDGVQPAISMRLSSFRR